MFKGRSFKKVIYVLAPFLAYYVVHDVMRFLMMYLLSYISMHSAWAYSAIREHDAVFSGIISLVDMLVGTVVLVILMKHDEEELSLWDYVNLNGISFYRSDRIHGRYFGWIIITVQAVTMAVGLNILIGLTGIIKISAYGDTVQAQYSIPLWFGLILYGIVSPAVEELLFRTIVYGRMKRRFHIAIAAIVSSMFFGLYHRNLVQGLYGFVMGLLMCLACEYVHSVIGSFLMHSAANLTIYIMGMKGVLTSLNSPVYCVCFIGAGLLTLFIEIFFSIGSVRKLGRIEGIEHVGVFYKDPTLF